MILDAAGSPFAPISDAGLGRRDLIIRSARRPAAVAEAADSR